MSPVEFFNDARTKLKTKLKSLWDFGDAPSFGMMFTHAKTKLKTKLKSLWDFGGSPSFGIIFTLIGLVSAFLLPAGGIYAIPIIFGILGVVGIAIAVGRKVRRYRNNRALKNEDKAIHELLEKEREKSQTFSLTTEQMKLLLTEEEMKSVGAGHVAQRQPSGSKEIHDEMRRRIADVCKPYIDMKTSPRGRLRRAISYLSRKMRQFDVTAVHSCILTGLGILSGASPMTIASVAFSGVTTIASNTGMFLGEKRYQEQRQQFLKTLNHQREELIGGVYPEMLGKFANISPEDRLKVYEIVKVAQKIEADGGDLKEKVRERFDEELQHEYMQRTKTPTILSDLWDTLVKRGFSLSEHDKIILAPVNTCTEQFIDFKSLEDKKAGKKQQSIGSKGLEETVKLIEANINEIYNIVSLDINTLGESEKKLRDYQKIAHTLGQRCEAYGLTAHELKFKELEGKARRYGDEYKRFRAEVEEYRSKDPQRVSHVNQLKVDKHEAHNRDTASHTSHVVT